MKVVGANILYKLIPIFISILSSLILIKYVFFDVRAEFPYSILAVAYIVMTFMVAYSVNKQQIAYDEGGNKIFLRTIFNSRSIDVSSITSYTFTHVRFKNGTKYTLKINTRDSNIAQEFNLGAINPQDVDHFLSSVVGLRRA